MMYFTPKDIKILGSFLQLDEPIIVYDCETTGLHPVKTANSPEAHIIQLSARKLEHEYGTGFSLVDEREWYIQPLESIPEKITELTGITDEFLEDKPEEWEVFEEIEAFFDGYAVCGYNNTTFDDLFMKRMYERYRREFSPYLSIDILKLARVMVGPSEVKNYRLETIADYLGIPDILFHDASGDAEATQRILEIFETRMLEREKKTGNMIPSYEAGIKTKVTSISRYEMGRISRIYANTMDPEVTFYFDCTRKGWEVKDKSLSTDRFNMPDMVSQVLRLARVPDEEKLARWRNPKPTE